MTNGTRILVVDDEQSVREMMAILLKRQGYDVATASSGVKAVEMIGAGAGFDLVVTDLLMDRGTGIDVLEAAKARDPHCAVILITAYGTTESAVEAMKKGAHDYLSKPFNLDEFVLIVRQALEHRELVRENIRLRAKVRGEYRFADMIGRSPAMREVIAVCQRVADTAATVLVSGESGTGKEVVARAIHFCGARAERRFVALNCGALPEPLMESELFGHVRGAFTGATEDKIGLFEAAEGGTILLDEVGELPASLQVKLLRVLEQRTIRPVGASGERPVDVRVISATNQDLAALVEAGRFRTDLYYRLNVIQIHLPRLVERREDLPELVGAFLPGLEPIVGRRISGVSNAAMRALLEHDFPGNVRELKNILERAATLATGPQIEVDDLPLTVMHKGKGASPWQQSLPQDGIDLDAALEALERRYIEQALARAGGVQTQAAKLLGVTFRSLRYRMGKLGLAPQEEEK
ncbi:MAG: sigma-54 dependent transcriptional regulator [Proteobacteria bacterium]|jgi:two-component system response regulator PilR (NtrC family)|nr:sigma-54 dependent transcriptional regulator [Pseudomonadota bacterium]